MMVYFIGSDHRLAPIKIGRSSSELSVARRLAHLQVGNPERLYLLNVYSCYPVGFDVEGDLHSKFSAARLTGEWFAPARDDRIEALATAPTRTIAEAIWACVLPSLTEFGYPERIKRRRGPEWMPPPNRGVMVPHLAAFERWRCDAAQIVAKSSPNRATQPQRERSNAP